MPFPRLLFKGRTRLIEQHSWHTYTGLELAFSAGGDYFTADKDHEACGWNCFVRDASMNTRYSSRFINRFSGGGYQGMRVGLIHRNGFAFKLDRCCFGVCSQHL